MLEAGGSDRRAQIRVPIGYGMSYHRQPRELAFEGAARPGTGEQYTPHVLAARQGSGRVERDQRHGLRPRACRRISTNWEARAIPAGTPPPPQDLRPCRSGASGRRAHGATARFMSPTLQRRTIIRLGRHYLKARGRGHGPARG